LKGSNFHVGDSNDSRASSTIHDDRGGSDYWWRSIICMCGGQKWLNANIEHVQINGSTYEVSWLPGRTPKDFQFVVGPPLIFFPDPFVEEKQSSEAASIVAEKLCRGPAKKLSGEQFQTVFRLTYQCD
jgi:hypothetical protein